MHLQKINGKRFSQVHAGGGGGEPGNEARLEQGNKLE